VSAILNMCRELREQITRIASIKTDAQHVEGLEDVHKSLESHARRTQDLVTSLKVQNAGGLIPKNSLPTKPQIDGLQKKIEAVSKQLRDKRTSVRQGSTWAQCDKAAQEQIKLLDQGLRDSWKAFVRGNMADVSGLKSFRSLDACKEAFRKVDELNGLLQGKTAALPATKAEVDEVESLGRQLKEWVGKLNFGEIPPAVEDFLKHAAAGGIRLVFLTDEVLAWLRTKKEFMESLKVIAGGSRF